MFAKYASLVKNLRGVLFFEKGGETGVEWLIRKFRYRNIGVPPSILKRERDLFKNRLGGKPFVELPHPVESVERFVSLIESSFGLEHAAAESVALASAYVSPLLVSGKRALKNFEPISLDSVESKIELTDKDWKLHLRIADYTVLDSFAWSVENAGALWEGKDLEEMVRSRKRKVELDAKRYWRLQRGTGAPWTFLLYLDLARPFAENPGALKELSKLPREEVSACLAIVPAVCMPS